MASQKRFPSLLSTLLVTACVFGLMGLSVSACTAPEDTLRGGLGEPCDMDRPDDCRDGYQCVDYVCTTLSECLDICERFDECGIDIDGCLAQCGTTVAGWGDGPLQAYKECFTEDHDCEALQDSDNPPQMCYNELEIPAERESRCEDFVNLAESCGSDSDAVNSLHNECRQAARTWGDDDWAQTDECDDGVRDCSSDLDCLNEVFDIEPEFDPPANGIGVPEDEEDINTGELNGESGG